MLILIAEPLDAAAVKLLQQQPGWEVVVSNPKEYTQHLANADALIVRSAVMVNAGVLSAAPKLRVIGRAGVGVDNIDMDAATRRGVLVMNTPGGNAPSVAEHALALMLGMARSIPQLNAAMHAGRWEKAGSAGESVQRHIDPGRSIGCFIDHFVCCLFDQEQIEQLRVNRSRRPLIRGRNRLPVTG